MPGQELTPEYRQQLDEKLAEFRRVSAELRDMMGQLLMPDYMELLAGGLGLSPGEIEVLTYDPDEDEDMPDGLEIPHIPENLMLPVRSLAGAAYMFRGVFTQMAAEGKPISEILEERGEYLLTADKVVGLWSEHFELEEDQ